jgi:protein O-GlcNAc transferase
VNSPREGSSGFANLARNAGVVYSLVFGFAMLVLGVSFAAGFVQSFRLFGMPSIGSDVTILGAALFAQGDYAAALEEYRLAGLIDPENYDSSPQLVFVAPHVNAEALVHQHRQRVNQRPGDAAAHFDLGRALQTAGQLTEAANHLERALALDASFPGLQAALGTVYLEADRTHEAVQTLRAALSSGASQPALHERLGLALYQLGEREEAVRHFEQARALRTSMRDSVR